MNDIIFFVDIDASGIERIFDEMKANGTNNFLFLVENKGNVSKNEEQIIIENIKANFNEISDKIELYKLSDKIKFDEEAYNFFDNIFTRLTKGEDQSKESEEDGCCRV